MLVRTLPLELLVASSTSDWLERISIIRPTVLYQNNATLCSLLSDVHISSMAKKLENSDSALHLP